MNVISRYLGATYNSAVHVGATFVDEHNALITIRGIACAVRFPSEQLRWAQCCGTEVCLELRRELGEESCPQEEVALYRLSEMEQLMS